MSAYYDLFEKPDIRQTGEQQPLYARFIPKEPSVKKNSMLTSKANHFSTLHTLYHTN